MAQQVDQDGDTPTFQFKSVELLKAQTLGIGSYGSVCKAVCDDLLCAAKIIHPTLVNPNAHKPEHNREHRLPINRFTQECDFMSTLKHPNIVQYLGTYYDSETGLPVLLMELMDDSLTHFLETSQDTLPYHAQVNFSHHISLAISYLHSNGITHRDLTSNNVLLCGDVKAKVTDFGMARLGDINPEATRVTLTMCPGTDVYMPPEAVKDPPVYTEKIDCFAIGTLMIQIMTRHFPEPGDRHKTIHTIDPRFPTIEARVSEIERRQNHISQVDPNHPLLSLAIDCLSDNGDERPSAHELCHRIAALTHTPMYTKSVSKGQVRAKSKDDTPEKEGETEIHQNDEIIAKVQIIQQKVEEIFELKQMHSQEIDALQQAIIEAQTSHSREKNTILSEKQTLEEECQQLGKTVRDQAQTIEERDEQLQQVFQQLEFNQQVTAQFQTRIQDLELTLQAQVLMHQNRKPSTTIASLKWTVENKAPIKMCRGPNATVSDNMVYFRAADLPSIYAYDSNNKTWDQLPECQNTVYSLVIIKKLLTIIGGRNSSGNVTNHLLSLTGEDKNKKWTEVFKSMPTKRSSAAAVCSGQALIVAGGLDKARNALKTVEVMNIDTEGWSFAADLPEPLFSASITICCECLYIVGGRSDLFTSSKSVYTCSLIDLFQSCQSRTLSRRFSLNSSSKSTVWEKIADLPVTESTCVSLHGQVLAIGGSNPTGTNTDVFVYRPILGTWEVISKMNISRRWCFAAFLPARDEIIVVGGRTSSSVSSETDSVELATVVY